VIFPQPCSPLRSAVAWGRILLGCWQDGALRLSQLRLCGEG